MDADELLEECCRDHHDGKPGAEARLLALWHHLVLLECEHKDWSAAYVGFREAVAEIGKPTFCPAVNFTTYLKGKIERMIRDGRRADRMPLLSPSRRTVSRHRKSGKKLACRTGDAAWFDDREEVHAEHDFMRMALENADLTERQRRLVRILAEGHKKNHAASMLGISSKTVTRDLAAVKRTISQGSALTLAV